jgi:hypothetical protein
MRVKKRTIVVVAFMHLIFSFLQGEMLNSHAQIAGDEAFDNLQWELVFEDEREGGIVQSICVTPDYIITLENVNDLADTPDILKAYYRNDVDADGNPVEKYSLATRINEIHYEHCNGITYNPNTNELIIALYTNAVPENRGSVYVLDAETFAYLRTVKVTDDYNLLGIDYMPESNQYLIQTDFEARNSFLILDENFELVEDLGEYEGSGMGNNFQDLCVSGDYILNFPLTLGMGIGDFLHVYSISRRELVAAPQIDFQFEDNIVFVEPESLCEIEPGVFLSVVNVDTDAEEKKVRFYEFTVPYNFEVNVLAQGADNNKKENFAAPRGSTQVVKFDVPKGYRVQEVLVNDKPIDLGKYKEEYELEDIQGNYNIVIEYAKKAMTGVIITVFVVIIIIALLVLRVIYIQKLRARKKYLARKRRRRLQDEISINRE